MCSMASPAMSKVGTSVTRSAGILKKPAVIWSREARPSTSEMRITGIAPSTVSAR